MCVWFLGREKTMMDVIVDILERSNHDPFFWISHIVIVAMLSGIVYNLWNNKRKIK
jgi:hypothetical protein